MISKQFRLSDREVKKVLQKGKPFFSYGIVLNYTKNKVPYNRFAMVLGSKSVNTNVTRNFFRRRFYDHVSSHIELLGKEEGFDYVFVVKKQMKLDKKNEESLEKFKKDLQFLIHKI